MRLGDIDAHLACEIHLLFILRNAIEAGIGQFNAAMESWNGSFMVEAIHGEQFKTREVAKRHIFEYIEVYYNGVRLHSRLGYKSTAAFEGDKVA